MTAAATAAPPEKDIASLTALVVEISVAVVQDRIVLSAVDSLDVNALASGVDVASALVAVGWTEWYAETVDDPC